MPRAVTSNEVSEGAVCSREDGVLPGVPGYGDIFYEYDPGGTVDGGEVV